MNHCILVMDDSAVTRSVIKKSLRLIGLGEVRIVEAADGLEGLAALNEGDVDLILMDLNMPRITGFQFLDAIEKKPPMADIPAVVISTERSAPRLEAILSRRNRRYLAKPFRPEQLKAVLDELHFNPAKETPHVA